MSKREPMLGDKINVLGAETIVVGFDMYQAEAPHFFMVTDSAGADLRVEWREGVWALPGTSARAVKTPPAPRPPTFPRTKEAKAAFQPAKPIGVAAVEAIKLSAEVLALHVQLTEARDTYYKASNVSDGDRMAATWPEYERCIKAVDQADPGFYVGRRHPIEKIPRYVLPDLDYAGISARSNYKGGAVPQEPEADAGELVDQVCRLCGCTEMDCSACIKKTGAACYWVEPDLCSACDPETQANMHKLHKHLSEGAQ